jgi:hypothetical protein
MKTHVTWRMKASPAKSSKTSASKKRSRDEARDADQSSSSLPSSPRPNPAKEWKKAKSKTEDLLALVDSGFLHLKEINIWHTATGDPYPMEKTPNEILMFARLMERGLMLPASDFFKGMLRYYGIKYLNPNGIFYTSIFVHFCKAFVGIKPHWILFRKFFWVKPQPSSDDPRVVGGTGIQMREDAAG